MKTSKGYRVVAPDRYLRVRDEPGTVTVSRDGETIARSTRAVRLIEGGHPAVLYVPREDVDVARLVPSERSFGCRWKGAAEYFHVDLRDRTLDDVVWGYPDAPEEVAALRERLAFDTAAFDVRVDDAPGGGSGDGSGGAARHDDAGEDLPADRETERASAGRPAPGPPASGRSA